MKSSTYKWIIGCLVGVVVILTTYLILREDNIICISFPETLSLAATISSLILSVIAMFYTYYSGRDTSSVFTQIQSITDKIDAQIHQISEDTKTNAETLSNMKEGMYTIIKAIDSSSKALDTIHKEGISNEDKQSAIKTMEDSKNSMIMFLEKINQNN